MIYTLAAALSSMVHALLSILQKTQNSNEISSSDQTGGCLVLWTCPGPRGGGSYLAGLYCVFMDA